MSSKKPGKIKLNGDWYTAAVCRIKERNEEGTARVVERVGDDEKVRLDGDPKDNEFIIVYWPVKMLVPDRMPDTGEQR